MKYPGGKNHGSAYPRIINQIPPHELFIEPFAGSAAIRRLMRPCRQSLLIDLDAAALGKLAGVVPPNTELLNGDGLAWLEEDRLCLDKNLPPTVVYCDPPYVASACASRLRYDHVLSDDQHTRLLCRLKQLGCYVLISGYWSELYADALHGWRVVSWPQITRGGTWAQEFLWCNYPEPLDLHDYQHLGAGFRERQDVRRQQQRWRKKLQNMTTLKRQALLSVLADLRPGAIGGNAERIHGPGNHGRNAEPADGDITPVILPMVDAKPGRSINGGSAESARVRPDPATAKLPSGDGPGCRHGRNAESGRRRPPAAETPIAAALGRTADGGHQTNPQTQGTL